MTVENTMTAGPTLRDKFLEDLANTKIIWDTAQKATGNAEAIAFWKKLKAKIENEDFEHWNDIDTNDKSLDKDELIEWAEKELGLIK